MLPVECCCCVCLLIVKWRMQITRLIIQDHMCCSFWKNERWCTEMACICTDAPPPSVNRPSLTCWLRLPTSMEDIFSTWWSAWDS
jgi:hypothetical protein